jgi:hypothetical protein
MSEISGERYSSRFTDGQVIVNEGPGKGFASYPWVLDRYERALDLSPAESWLLHRLIKYAWKSGGLVFVSMRKICREAKTSRAGIDKLVRLLLQKGYISEIERGHKMTDHRVRYDISGVYLALELAVKCDRNSKWSIENGEITVGDFFNHPEDDWFLFTSPGELNTWFNERGKRFNWGEGRSEDWQEIRRERSYRLLCEDCGEEFIAGASNAARCPSCQAGLRKRRWEQFQKAYEKFEETIINDELLE